MEYSQTVMKIPLRNSVRHIIHYYHSSIISNLISISMMSGIGLAALVEEVGEDYTRGIFVYGK